MAPLFHWDSKIFELINQHWTSPWLDAAMRFMTLFQETRYVLLALVIVWLLIGKSRALKVLIGCILSVVIADATAAKIIKPLVGRNRPEFSENQVRLIVPHQGSPSFPSNHAANTAAVATYLSYTIPALSGYAWLVAFVVAYSRVYVGVHYPLDVLGGVVVGIFSAWLANAILAVIFEKLGLRQVRPIPEPPRFRRRKY